MFTLYKASAGSGKTSRLVVEYLALCLPQPEKFKHVLAITFTNNATAEMKSRIVDTLSEFAFEPEITSKFPIYHTYNQVIAKIALHLPENEKFPYIKKQSKLLLEKILYEYDRFSISTIDSFFQRILRAFALEFGLSSQFNLEIELDDFFRETTAVLLHRISKNNEHLTQRVLDLVENMMLEKGKWKIEKEILKLLKISLEEEVYLPLKELQESENTDFEQAKKKINQEIYRLRNQLKNFTTKEEKKSEACLMLKEQLLEYEFFGKNLFQLALLFDLKMIMDEIKMQDNLFYLSETNTKIKEKLGNDDVPFIYEKIGNQYSYFFIDEFQDTSKLQWQNMIPLLREALAGTNRFYEQGKVFLFGDVKQAIYRFRNGDADILQQLSNIEGYKSAVLPYSKPEEDYRVELLDTNFRSSKKVIEFNNAFFDFLTAENGPFHEAKDFYEDVKQKTKPTAEEGLVTVRFQEEEDNRKFQEFMPEHVLETVLDALQRGYAYKNIAVLVSNNDSASAIGTFLIANNIPIISAESLQLSASSEINLLIATLQYLVSEEDKLAKLTMIHYLAQQNNLLLENYMPCMQNEHAFQQFLTNININISRKKLNSLPLFTLIVELSRIMSLSVCNPFLIRLLDETEKFATKRNGSTPLFLEWWEEKGQTLALSTPPGIDAVTISTIHKSKGLEYPVVIFPFSRYSNFKTKPDIFVKDENRVTGLEYDWVTLSDKKTPARYRHKYAEESKKTLIDQLNKLYVAHTRARTELHIITEKPNARAGNYSKFLAAFGARYEVGGMRYEVCGERYAVDGEWEIKGRKQKTKSNTPLCEPSLLPSAHHLAPHTSYRIPHTTQQLRGIFIHNFLSSLTTFPQNEKEIDWVVQNVEEAYKKDLANIFYKILNDKSLSPYFVSEVKVLNETSILFPNGNLLRPDRVVFLEDRTAVIDYKTGEPNASHKEQLEQYCEAIRAMGYGNVEGHILYV
ncbi:MAG: UvrD-helicase domain-containing protein [Bacteroidetes bacterium]|nr:UvrD-helicase domain-containing protein [Bacteroidota bacterium]MCL2301877.1 UvrD-helicase domain-containing protein [Lentimicrobiaceae bacterium]